MINKSNWTIEEDNKIIKLFHEGLSNREIAKKINRTFEATKKRVQKLKKEFGLKEKTRKLKQIEKKEILKSLKHESNKYMSDRSLVKSSLSAYKSNSKGDLVLDIKKAEEDRCVFTLDMPKAILNNDKREYEKSFIYTRKS